MDVLKWLLAEAQERNGQANATKLKHCGNPVNGMRGKVEKGREKSKEGHGILAHGRDR